MFSSESLRGELVSSPKSVHQNVAEFTKTENMKKKNNIPSFHLDYLLKTKREKLVSAGINTLFAGTGLACPGSYLVPESKSLVYLDYQDCGKPY